MDRRLLLALGITSLGIASLLGFSSTPPLGTLVINEVCLGSPGPAFVEIRNLSASPQSLAAVTLETSQGVFSLSDVTPTLPAGAYFVVSESSVQNAGISPDGLSKCFASHILDQMVDTVLLKRSGQLQDAMSYGTQVDTSARYNAAVNAHEFTAGQFVNINGEFEFTSIGRSGNSADTNNLASDWRTHGGINACRQSAGDPNTAIFAGEDCSVSRLQAFINEALRNVYGISVTSASHANYIGDANSTATHTFDVTNTDFGTRTIVGSATHDFTPSSSPGVGDYSIHNNGSFTDGTLTFSITLDEQRTGNVSTLSMTASVAAPNGVTYPYTESQTYTRSGVRGNYSVAHTRTSTAWDGVQRNVTSTETITWSLSAGVINSTASAVSITADFPPAATSPYSYTSWVQAGSQSPMPNAVYTSETTTFNSVTQVTNGVLTMNFSNYNISHGTYGSATHTNMVFTSSMSGSTLSASYTYDFNGPLGTTHFSTQTTGNYDSLTGDISLHGNFYKDGQLVSSTDSYIDPKLWGWLKKTLQWAGNIVCTAVVGSVCYLGTCAAIAAGAGLTAGTGGAGAPAGVAIIMFTVGMCATATAATCILLWPD